MPLRRSVILTLTLLHAAASDRTMMMLEVDVAGTSMPVDEAKGL
jgi:hypothetical protein